MDRVRRMLHVEEIHSAGITGKDITVAILDSGISRHPDYAARILKFKDFVNGRRECYDDASHGSHVTGILAGDGKCSRGKYRGIAPGCRILHLKILNRQGQGQLENILAAIEWILQNREVYGIRILSLSAGTASSEEDYAARQLVQAVERMWDAGIAVVVAAGNRGPVQGSITVPGNSRKVITVGANDDGESSASGRRKQYSGCGPTRDCICKPELVAPGWNVFSCSAQWRKGRYYERKSGTSMAVPAVAGLLALLLEKEPLLSNLEMKIRLKESCTDLGLARNRQGWGIPDARKLLRLSDLRKEKNML